jgi:hypothetical protein
MMKKTLSQLIVLFFVLFTGYNIYLNREARIMLKTIAPGIDYLFAFSVIPDRITFINFEYLNISAAAMTIDFNLGNILKKDYEKSVDGIIAFGLKMRFVKKDGAQEGPRASTRAFIIPFCKYFYIFKGSIEFEDIRQKYKFFISDLTGFSSYKGTTRSDEFLTLDVQGNILGNPGQKAYMKFFFYPYYKNRFFLNVFATGIDAKIFEPMFRKNRLNFYGGKVNFLVQLKGEMRRIYLNNIMQFNQVKIRENTGLDLKGLFGVSVEQLVDFLKDSKGDFYINFNLSFDDSEFNDIFTKYGDAFRESIGGRLKLGIATAPLRQIKDLIWNLTGENVVRIYKLFGGK